MGCSQAIVVEPPLAPAMTDLISVTLQHLMHDYKMIKPWTGIENTLAIMSI